MIGKMADKLTSQQTRAIERIFRYFENLEFDNFGANCTAQFEEMRMRSKSLEVCSGWECALKEKPQEYKFGDYSKEVTLFYRSGNIGPIRVLPELRERDWEGAWKIVDKIKKKKLEVYKYPVGSSGPVELAKWNKKNNIYK
jgi:hypothetical protein